MKIRTGFVSNSSSSSFIVGKHYKTVFDLAIEMLTIRNNDYKDNCKNYKNYEDKYFSEINNIKQAIKDGKDPDTSICFSTCKYDTFIKKVFGHYIVSTCNNHPFLQKLKGIQNCPIEVEEWLKKEGYTNDDYYDNDFSTYDFSCHEIFWHSLYNLEISNYDYTKDLLKEGKNFNFLCSNKNHFCYKVELASNKEIICPMCYVEKQKKKPNIEDSGDNDEN